MLVDVLLAIIAAELGLLLLGHGFRVFTETMLVRETMRLKKNPGGLPPGFRELSPDEMKAMGIDLDKLNGVPEKSVHGHYA